MVHQWRLYGTSGCHLCEQAYSIVAQLKNDFCIELLQLDIASDPLWVEQFGERIPVLENIDTGKMTGWPFDPQVLADWLEPNGMNESSE